MTDNDLQFLEFITGTLLPDMAEEGPSGTADDIKRLVGIIRRLNRRGMHLHAALQDATQENASLTRMVDGLQGRDLSDPATGDTYRLFKETLKN